MSDWSIDDFSECKQHGKYVDNGEGCPVCNTQYTSLEGLIEDIKAHVESPKKGLLTAVPNFSNEVPVKIGKTPKRGGSQAWWYKDGRLDSTNEKDRFLFLEVLEERGIISGLDRQWTEIILQPVIVDFSVFFPEFKQADEKYKVDFIYMYKGYTVYEDAKGSRFTDVKKDLKPRVKPASATKAKALQEILASRDMEVFIYSVFHKGTWHYFNTMLKESAISLR